MDFANFKEDMFNQLIKITNDGNISFPKKQVYPIHMPFEEQQYRDTINLIIAILEEYEKRKNVD